jgi:hypothetical protein
MKKIFLLTISILTIGLISMFFLLDKSEDNEKMIIDDLSNPQNNQWVFFTDRVMGGVSRGDLTYNLDKEQNFYKMQGNVSTANNGGFIQFRTNIKDLPGIDFNGIRIMVRGNNQEYYIHIRTNLTPLPWQYYQTKFKVNEKWEIVEIPFNQFSKSNFYQPGSFKSKDIRTLAIVAYGKDYDANIDLGLIEFY